MKSQLLLQSTHMSVLSHLVLSPTKLCSKAQNGLMDIEVKWSTTSRPLVVFQGVCDTG